MTIQVDTVFVWVNDLETSLNWYEALGFIPGPRYGPWQSMEVDGDVAFALHEGIRDPGMSTSVTTFRIEDLDATISRLAGQGIRPSDNEVTDTGTARFTTFTDPDGNEIQLLERPE